MVEIPRVTIKIFHLTQNHRGCRKHLRVLEGERQPMISLFVLVVEV